MVVDAMTYDSVAGLLPSGYNGGQWNGNGLRSSSANATTRTLGIALASDLFTSGDAAKRGHERDDPGRGG